MSYHHVSCAIPSRAIKEGESQEGDTQLCATHPQVPLSQAKPRRRLTGKLMVLSTPESAQNDRGQTDGSQNGIPSVAVLIRTSSRWAGDASAANDQFAAEKNKSKTPYLLERAFQANE